SFLSYAFSSTIVLSSLFHLLLSLSPSFSLFFFNDPAPTEIYTLSLHDALPILSSTLIISSHPPGINVYSIDFISLTLLLLISRSDRKSTRLNSSHVSISYAVFCLKKKKKQC